MSTLTPKSASALLRKDEAMLLSNIGRDLHSSILGADSLPSEEALRTGKNWLMRNMDHLRGTVCVDERVQKVFHEQSDQVTLAIAVADVLTGVLTGVSIGTVACLLVKMGLAKVCRSHWDRLT